MLSGLTNTIGGEGGSSDAITGIGVSRLAIALSYLYGHLTRLVGYEFATELILKVFAIFDLGTQTSSLAFVIEIGSIDGIAIGIKGYISPNGTP